MIWQIIGLIVTLAGVGLWLHERMIAFYEPGPRRYIQVASGIAVVLGLIMLLCSGPLPWQ